MEPPTVEDVVGTVIHGTLSPEDLLTAFFDQLQVLDGERASELRNSYPKVFQSRKEGWDEDTYMDAGDCMEALIDSLDACAPEGLFFGSHPGDGSDYGFWPVEGE